MPPAATDTLADRMTVFGERFRDESIAEDPGSTFTAADALPDSEVPSGSIARDRLIAGLGVLLRLDG